MKRGGKWKRYAMEKVNGKMGKGKEDRSKGKVEREKENGVRGIVRLRNSKQKEK